MKPKLRGYIPQFAFFIALLACAFLILHSKDPSARIINLIYSFTLVGMYGVSAIYHRPQWNHRQYLIIRKLDHATIFALIAGTATPICLLVLNKEYGLRFIFIFWGIAILGMLFTLFWTKSPKWLRAIVYVMLGWLFIPFFSEIRFQLGDTEFFLLVAGGVFYTLGALIYALRRPNPFPYVFGYHEIFHAFVVIASLLHFIVIYNLTT